MEFLSPISGFFSGVAGGVVPVLFVLTVVVFFHELGHFLVARWCGVAVKVFSIGFGPELIGRTDRSGTRWRISAIPLGGYVRFLGDDSEASTPDRDALKNLSEEDRQRSFANKSVGQRAAIVVAGPAANFLLTIVILATVFTLYGRQVVEPRVQSVQPESAAEAAGILPGDLILTIDGKEIDSFASLRRIVTISSDRTLNVEVERDGRTLALAVTPKRREITDRFGNVYRVGQLGVVGATDESAVHLERYSVPGAVWLAAQETWFLVDHTLSYVGRIVMGMESADQLGGPLRVAQVSSQAASVGFGALISLTAWLSTSIGLVNLFPIPILDGGHLMFYAAEAIRGRPLSDRVQDVGFRIGMALVIMLMIFVTWNDIPGFLRWVLPGGGSG